MNDCTSLVVRDDYWQSVLERECHIRGIRVMKIYELRKYCDLILHFSEATFEVIAQAFNQIIDALAEFAREAVEVFSETLKKFMNECDIRRCDDAMTILDKFENHYLYLQRKQAIQEREYIKNCFKLARVHHCIRNQHIRK